MKRAVGLKGIIGTSTKIIRGALIDWVRGASLQELAELVRAVEVSPPRKRRATAKRVAKKKSRRRLNDRKKRRG